MSNDPINLQPSVEAFIQSESFTLKVLNTSLNGLYVYDVKLGRNIFINAQYTELTGYTLYDLMAMDDAQFFSLFHPEDHQRVSDHMQRIVLNNTDVPEIEYRFKTKDGRWIWCLSRDSVFARSEDGSVAQFIGTFFDITSQKESREALVKSEKLYRELAANLPSGAAFVVDHELRYLLAEGQALREAGMKTEDLEGKTIWEALDSELASQYEPYYRSALDGRSFQWEHFSHGRYYATFGRPLRDADGNIYAALAVSYDITERTRAEKALKTSEARFHQIADSMPQLVWTANPNGSVDYYNKRYTEFDGIERTPDGKYNWAPVLHPDDISPTTAAWRNACRNGLTYQIEHRVKRNDGTFHWYLSRAVPIRDENDRVVKWFGTATDIDRIKQAERELHELNQSLEQKIAERTRLVESRTRQLQALTVELIEAEESERARFSELLHDNLQQMLASAKFHQELAADSLPADSNLDKAIRILRQCIDEARQIAHDLSPLIFKHASLRAVFQELATSMKERFGLDVSLEVDEALINVETPLKSFFFRTAQELLFNVVKHAGVKQAQVRLYDAGGSVLLTVADRGRGFDPGRAHKRSDANTGLGLPRLRVRTQYMGGDLTIDSHAGKGSRIVVTIPLRLDAAISPQRRKSDLDIHSPRPHEEAEKAPENGRIRVLFVDDHRVMRKGLVDLVKKNPMIEVAGEAASGTEAIDRVRRLRPDVVVMDVAMPGMDGIEATRQIKEAFPTTRIVGLTMFEDEETHQRMVQAGAESVICKTGPSTELLNAIYPSANRGR